MLGGGEIELVGRMRYSSNGAFLVEVDRRRRRRCRPSTSRGAASGRCGTSPTARCASARSRRTSCRAALGWGVVPVTVLREEGRSASERVQRFVEHDPEEHYFTLLEANQDRFRQFAAFDVLANNTDRKGGHCLHDLANDVILGIDHGLTFHRQWKLRTVIWDFAGEPVPAALVDDVLPRRRASSTTVRSASGSAVLLAPDELAAIAMRAADLLRDGHFPVPDAGLPLGPVADGLDDEGRPRRLRRNSSVCRGRRALATERTVARPRARRCRCRRSSARSGTGSAAAPRGAGSGRSASTPRRGCRQAPCRRCSAAGARSRSSKNHVHTAGSDSSGAASSGGRPGWLPARNVFVVMRRLAGSAPDAQ